MAVDVIVSWPRCCDFPAWRQFIRDNRERFKQVFVVFTELAGADISGFVRENFEEATFIDSPPTNGRDWRDVAVNAALDRSIASHVWFTEQDFEVTDPDVFWPQITHNLAGIRVDDRPFHPACLMVSRDLIDQTSRYFGPEPIDHFAAFGWELIDVAASGHAIPPSAYRHLQGISESQMLAWQGEPPRFKPEQFTEWVSRNVMADVPIEPNWLWAMA